MNKFCFTAKSLLLIVLIALGASGCEAPHQENLLSKQKPEYWLNLKPVKFEKLPGWNGDKHSEALAVFLRSCERTIKKDPKKFLEHCDELMHDESVLYIQTSQAEMILNISALQFYMYCQTTLVT